MSSFSRGVSPEALRRAGVTPERRGKYGNRKTDYNGYLYASALEAACAAQLDVLMNVHHLVTAWERQVPYDLGAGVRYVADFRVTYTRGSPRVIDAKGVETDVFRIKRRLFEALHGPLDVVKHWQAMPTEGHVSEPSTGGNP